MAAHQATPVLVFDPAREKWPTFYNSLKTLRPTSFHDTPESLLEHARATGGAILLADIEALRSSGSFLQRELLSLRAPTPLGLTTDLDLAVYLADLPKWGVYQVITKGDTPRPRELAQSLQCIENPLHGFGLRHYIDLSAGIMRVSITSNHDKQRALEEVMNYFATAGFDIHGLYDVRLVLEEAVNNAIYHAYKNEDGADKYRVSSFDHFSKGEEITLEFAVQDELAGFAVSDTAGTLKLSTIFSKLHRQLGHDGLYDENGRGLHLSRLLSSLLVINIHENQRTQMIALFDERRHRKSPKSFLVNFCGSARFAESLLDPELD